jgi:hypothetical protein
MLGFVLRDENDEQDDFDDAPERSFDEYTGDLGHFPREFLACKTEQVSYGDHSNVASREDGDWQPWKCVMQDNGDGHEGPQQIRTFRCAAAGLPRNFEKVRGIEACATALAVGVDVLREDLVEERRRLRVVVIGWHCGRADVLGCVLASFTTPIGSSCAVYCSEARATVRTEELQKNVDCSRRKPRVEKSAAQPPKNKEVALWHAPHLRFQPRLHHQHDASYQIVQLTQDGKPSAAARRAPSYSAVTATLHVALGYHVVQTGVKFSSDRIAEVETDRHRIHRYDINIGCSSRGRRKKIEGILGKPWHDANNHYIQISTSRKTTSHAALLFTPCRCRMLVGCDCSQLWPFSWRTRPMARSLIVWSQIHGTWSLARHSPSTMLVPLKLYHFQLLPY